MEQVLRRIGLVFILGLVLQPRISGQAILLPVAAAAMGWALMGLRPIVVSPEGRRAWATVMGLAGFVAVLGLIGWHPDTEPGGLSVVVLFVFIAGVLAYVRFTSGWCERAGWIEARDHLRRSRINLVGAAITTALALAAIVAFGDRPDPAQPDPEWWNLVAGRVVSNGWVIAFSVAIFIGWVGASIELERGAKLMRAALAGDRDAESPTA